MAKKQKTNKKIAKRFQLTKTGKVKSRRTGQAHFNSRANGNTTRKKRSDTIRDEVASTKTLARALSI